MERRHEELLKTRLEEVIDKGFAPLLWSELYRWFNKKRLTKNDYLEIARMWSEIAGKEHGELQYVSYAPFGPNDSGIVLLAGGVIEPFSELCI